MSVVIINDHKVASMMASPAFKATFPFLVTAQKQAAVASQKAQKKGKKKCGKCGRKNRASQTDYASVRKQIAALPDGQKSKMKRMLGAKQVQVDYTNGNGKKIRLRF